MKSIIFLIYSSIIFFLSGCATSKPIQTYFVDSFILHTAEKAQIQKEWKKVNGAYPEKEINGFCMINKNEIWVMYGIEKSSDGKPLPDMENLGHEVAHLIFGRYHK